MLFCFLLISTLVFSLVSNYNKLETENLIYIGLFSMLFAFTLCFTLFNLYLLQKNYPDSALNSARNNAYLCLGIIYIITVIIIVVLYCYGMYDTVKRYKDGKDDEMGLIALIILTIFIFTLVYILINGLQLKKLIQHNAAEKQLAEIENFFLKQ